MLNDFILIIISMFVGFGIGNHRGKNNTNKKIIKMLEDEQKMWDKQYNTQK